MFGGFPDHFPGSFIGFRGHIKPTKKNIKQLIEQERKVSSF